MIIGGLMMPAATAAQAPAQLAQKSPSKPKLELRVCADPDNLPFSNAKGEGFENKIAELIAAEFGVPLHYTWHPQRRGFIRRTLGAGKCNLVMGVPADYDLVVATKPYYRSSYVFVTRKDRNLGLKSFDDPALHTIKIGLHAIGDDGANTPPAHSLANRGITGNIVGFRMWDVDSAEDPQGDIIDAVASGEIDVAIVWGPFGGYFARQQPVPLEIVPVPVDMAALPVAYDVSLGVRKGNDVFKARLDAVLERRKGDIREILTGYGVPLVDDVGPEPVAKQIAGAVGGLEPKEK